MEHKTISDKKFDFKNKYKLILIFVFITGIIGTIIGISQTHDHGVRAWANFLLNNFFFLAIALSAVVFLAVHNLGVSGWQVSLQRVPEAMSSFLNIGSVLMLIILAGLIFGLHHLYHWAHLEHSDPILELKKAYLNTGFFTLRSLSYLAGWVIFGMLLRKYSLLQDSGDELAYHKKIGNTSGLFIVFFAVTSSMSAWDWIMSLDPHWFSTLFGWYIFSGFLVSGIASIILITLILKSMGYMQHVNKEHLHDLGKYLFGFSILWAYLWFSQFMLIWYGNVPEETAYFIPRTHEFKTLFLANLVINFAFPFLALMTRNSKRISWYLGIVAIVVLIGHWLDYYIAIMPGTVGGDAQMGILEVGMTIAYIGLFLFTAFTWLNKKSVVPMKHPFLQESLEYHTQY